MRPDEVLCKVPYNGVLIESGSVKALKSVASPLSTSQVVEYVIDGSLSST